MGADEKIVRKIIEKIEKVVTLLANEVVDDVHLSSQVARRMHKYLLDIKSTLIRIERAPNTSNAVSRNQSRPQTPHHDGEQDQQGLTQTTLPQVNNALAFSTYDPLANIPAKQIGDLMDKAFVPPPNYNTNTENYDIPGLMDDNGIDQSVVSGEGGDWFAADMGNIWASPTAGAHANQGAHSMIGPTVGNLDWIDLMHSNPDPTFDPNMHWQMRSPTGFQNNGYHQW